jgi:hypothetical protein
MEFFRLILLLARKQSEKGGVIGIRFSGECDLMAGKNSPLFEIALVLVCVVTLPASS